MQSRKKSDRRFDDIEPKCLKNQHSGRNLQSLQCWQVVRIMFRAIQKAHQQLLRQTQHVHGLSLQPTQASYIFCKELSSQLSPLSHRCKQLAKRTHWLSSCNFCSVYEPDWSDHWLEPQIA